MKKASLSLRLEQAWPWIGAIAGVCIWRWLLDSPFPSAPDSLFGTSATVSSIFASFLGVSKAIILSIKGTESFRILENLGYGNVLFNYLRDGIFSAVAFACLSVVGFFVVDPASAEILEYFKIFWVFFGLAALLTYMRVTGLLSKLLRYA